MTQLRPSGRYWKMYNISLLCPTRNRIDGLTRMWSSALDTASNPDKLELVLYVDHDDLETIQFLKSNLPEASTIFSDPNKPEIYSNLHNKCCANSQADIVFGCADDLIFRSQDWDNIILNKFEEIDDKIAFIFGNDGHWGSNFGTHGFFHKNWFNTLGYLAPPIFTVDYSDNYVNDLSNAISRRFYIEDIFIEHMHWTFGKMEMDTTAKDAHQRRHSTNNAEIYSSFETMQNQREDMQKLREIMNE